MSVYTVISKSYNKNLKKNEKSMCTIGRTYICILQHTRVPQRYAGFVTILYIHKTL